MRVTGFWSLAGAIIAGIIIANLIANPEGTKAAGNAVVNLEKPTYNALLGHTTA